MDNSVKKIMENKEKIIKIEKLVMESWHDYFKNFKKFITIYLYALLGFIPLLACLIVIAIFTAFDFWSALPMAAQIFLGFIFGVLAVLSVLAAIYYSVRAKAATLLLIKNNYFSALESFNDSKKYFWGFFGVSLLTAVVVIAWGFVFLIPALIFGIYYTFASYVLIAEDKRAFSSMERSYDLVRGYWWPVFGRLALLALMMMIISLIISFPVSFMDETSLLAIVYNVFVNIIWFILSPYFVVYSYNIYKSLKEKNK